MPVCQESKKGFASWADFNAHNILWHGGQDKYVCKYYGCTKEFKSWSGYNTHEFHHEENKKKWQCKTCLVCFMYESQLLRHEDTHKDSKSYKCPSKSCKKFTDGFESHAGFELSYGYSQGVQIPCTVARCLKTFPIKSYLKEHLNIKHRLGYECKNIVDGCTFKCRSMKMLNDHEKLFCPFNSDRSDANGNGNWGLIHFDSHVLCCSFSQSEHQVCSVFMTITMTRTHVADPGISHVFLLLKQSHLIHCKPNVVTQLKCHFNVFVAYYTNGNSHFWIFTLYMSHLIGMFLYCSFSQSEHRVCSVFTTITMTRTHTCFWPWNKPCVLVIETVTFNTLQTWCCNSTEVSF